MPATQTRRQRQAERDLAAWLTADPRNREAYDYLVGLEQTEQLDTFTGDVLRKTRRWGSMSDRQRDAVLRSRDGHAEWTARREAERVALADVAPLATGRRRWVTGEIVSVRWRDGMYPGYKIVVREAEGNKVWGSLPASCDPELNWTLNDAGIGSYDALVGRTVTFTATITAADGDPHFGFFKRPANARIVFAAEQLDVAPDGGLPRCARGHAYHPGDGFCETCAEADMEAADYGEDL